MDKRVPVVACTLSLAVLAFVLFTFNLSFAQQRPDFARDYTGDYAGVLGSYHVKLHIAVGTDGKLTGTADNPDAGLSGMLCTNFSVKGQVLSFTVPVVRGTWSGVLSRDGTLLFGMWLQDTSLTHLGFTRVTSNGAGAANTAAGSRTATMSRISSATYGGMAMTQHDVNYDESNFKVTSVDGVPRSVVEMRPDGQLITSTIMPNGRTITDPASGDSCYADRIRAVLKIDAAGPAAAGAGRSGSVASKGAGAPSPAMQARIDATLSGHGAPQIPHGDVSLEERCDELANSPNDPLRVDTGVRLFPIIEAPLVPEALRSCQGAVQLDPTPHYLFLGGRALLAANRYAEAFQQLKLAASGGYAAAMEMLGSMYSNGYGVPKSDTEALAWFRKAAGAGSAFAMFNLGWIYAHGDGSPKRH